MRSRAVLVGAPWHVVCSKAIRDEPRDPRSMHMSNRPINLALRGLGSSAIVVLFSCSGDPSLEAGEASDAALGENLSAPICTIYAAPNATGDGSAVDRPASLIHAR